MKDIKTKSALKLLLFILLLMIFINSIKLVVDTVLERPHWVVMLQLPQIPILFVIAIVIYLDLAKQDDITLQGLVKSKVRNRVVITVESGIDRKFTIKNDRMKDIHEDDNIEVQYYKRTKAVISIKSINQE